MLEHGDAAVASQCRDPGRLRADSLPTDTLALFWTEVREIAAELQPETVALIQVDAAVQDAAIHASGDLPERIAIKGRGGTDFRPGFAWLSEQGLRLGCCPYLTDIKCDRYPEAEPDYPVVLLGSAARRAQPPTLGRAHRHGGATRLCVSAADERGKPIRSKEQAVHYAFVPAWRSSSKDIGCRGSKNVYIF